MSHTQARLPVSAGALLLLVLATTLAGREACGATLTGTLTDRESGAPLAFASVTVFGDETDRGALADSTGVWGMSNLSGGTYELRFSSLGYRTKVDTVQVAATDTVRVDAALVPEGPRMEEVEVTADPLVGQRRVQTSVVVLEAAELADVPGVGESDPIRALQLLPGVQAASDISSGLYVRGGGPDQTLILLDQVPVYNPTHAFGLFSTFNADAIDRVTLYKGAYPAEYGGRLGAVLDVQNRTGNRSEFQGNAAVSTITGRLTLEGPVGNGAWFLSGRRTYLEPILDALRSEDNQIPSYYFYDLNGSVSLSGVGADRILVTGYSGRDRLGLDLDQDSSLRLDWGNSTLSASYQHLFGQNVLGTVLVSGSEYQSEAGIRAFTTPVSFENRLRDFTARGDLAWQWRGGHRLRAGAAVSRFDFVYRQLFNRDTQIDFQSQPTDVSVYLEDEWSSDRTAIRAGVRARHFSEGSREFLEPRFSVSRAITPTLRGKVGGGLYHQYLQLVSTEALSAADFYVPIDSTAAPGQSWQTVIGVDWTPTRKYRFTAEMYHTDLNDLVVLDNRAPVDQASFQSEDLFLTGGHGWATGLELFAQKRTGALTGWVGTTFGWTRRRFAQLNLGEAFPPKYDRRVDVNVVTRYRRAKWTYGAVFVYGTGQAFTPATARYGIRNPATGEYPESGSVLPGARNSSRLLPYHRLDVSVRRDFRMFGQPAEWYVQVFNLYSRRNEWFVQFDTTDLTTEPTVVRMLPIIPSLGVSFAF